mmetsp:Transcript_52954/g.146751  ORF Transcript_52954/g.146751 Transcript_52954/m.146751 type:complete len:330 (-) Transcript_52954:922-1911(-)
MHCGLVAACGPLPLPPHSAAVAADWEVLRLNARVALRCAFSWAFVTARSFSSASFLFFLVALLLALSSLGNLPFSSASFGGCSLTAFVVFREAVQPSPSRIMWMNSWKSISPSPFWSRSATSCLSSSPDRSPSTWPPESSCAVILPLLLMSNVLKADQHTFRLQQIFLSKVAAMNSVYEKSFSIQSGESRNFARPPALARPCAAASSTPSVWKVARRSARERRPSPSASSAAKASREARICSALSMLAMICKAARLNLLRERKPWRFSRIVASACAPCPATANACASQGCLKDCSAERRSRARLANSFLIRSNPFSETCTQFTASKAGP